MDVNERNLKQSGQKWKFLRILDLRIVKCDALESTRPARAVKNVLKIAIEL